MVSNLSGVSTVQNFGKKTYKNMSKLYKKEHNTALSRLHNIKCHKNIRNFENSVDAFEQKVENKKFPASLLEFEAFEKVFKDGFKVIKEKTLSLYYSIK